MIWLAIILPVLFAIAALVFFRKQIAYWEPFIPIAVTVLVIVFFRYIGITSLTKDTEYWGNYVTSVRYYEDWDYWHVETCSRQVPCGTDSKGNTQYCTEYYDCSHRDYYSEYWTMVLNDGNEINISSDYYNHLVKQFGTVAQFVDMSRDYYTKDGDMYSTSYPNTYETYEYIASEHTYENKVQASTSIFNYPEVSAKDISKYKLYDYPEVKDNIQNTILSPIKVTDEEQKQFNYINGMLGADKKVHVWICLFEYATNKAGFLQEAYWKRGNKNELVMCIGIDKEKNITWVHVFGWSKNKLIEIETRDYIISQKKLDLMKLGEWLYPEVKEKWQKTSFEEFAYLSIEPPFWAKLTTWLVAFFACVGIYIWIIRNNFTSSDINGDGYDEIDEDDDSGIQRILNKLKTFFKL